MCWCFRLILTYTGNIGLCRASCYTITNISVYLHVFTGGVTQNRKLQACNKTRSLSIRATLLSMLCLGWLYMLCLVAHNQNLFRLLRERIYYNSVEGTCLANKHNIFPRAIVPFLQTPRRLIVSYLIGIFLKKKLTLFNKIVKQATPYIDDSGQ